MSKGEADAKGEVGHEGRPTSRTFGEVGSPHMCLHVQPTTRTVWPVDELSRWSVIIDDPATISPHRRD